MKKILCSILLTALIFSLLPIKPWAQIAANAATTVPVYSIQPKILKANSKIKMGKVGVLSRIAKLIRADLVITNVTTGEIEDEEDEIYLNVTVKNNGKSTAKKFIVYAEDQTGWTGESEIVRFLKKGKSIVVPVYLDDEDPAYLEQNNPHNFEIMVDAYNTVRESKENNNFAEYNFYYKNGNIGQIVYGSVNRSSDTPVSRTVNMGEKNVDLLHFDVTPAQSYLPADENTPRYIYGISYGLEGTGLGYVKKMYLYQGNQLIQSFDYSTVSSYKPNYYSNIISLPYGTTQKFSIKVDLQEPVNTDILASLAGAVYDLTMTQTKSDNGVDGDFPIMGNNMTIKDTATQDNIIMVVTRDANTPPAREVMTGSTNVGLLNFTAEAKQNVTVNQLNMGVDGDNNQYVQNLHLYANGTLVRKITYNSDGSKSGTSAKTINIPKGNTMKFQMTADLRSEYKTTDDLVGVLYSISAYENATGQRKITSVLLPMAGNPITVIRNVSNVPVLTVTQMTKYPAVVAPKGAKRVEMLNLQAAADSKSDFYLDYLRFKWEGSGSMQDIKEFAVYQGLTHYGFGTLNYANNEVVFDFRKNHGSPLISAGGSFNFVIKIDLNETAGTDNRHVFKLTGIKAHLPAESNAKYSDYSIYSGSGMIYSREVTVSSAKIGEAIISKINTPLNPLIGNNQDVASFSVKADYNSPDGQNLKSMTLQIAGSAANASIPLRNLRLMDKDTGVVYAKQDVTDPKKRVVFILNRNTEGLRLQSGEQRNFLVRADITGEVSLGSTLRIYLPNENYLYSEDIYWGNGVRVNDNSYDNSSQDGTDASYSTIGTINETKATLSIIKAPFPESYDYLEIPQGREEYTKFATFYLQTGDKPVTLNSIVLTGATTYDDYAIGDYIKTVKTEFDVNGAKSAYQTYLNSKFNGQTVINNLNLRLPANSQSKMNVYANMARGAKKYPMGVYIGIFNVNDITASDNDGNVVSIVNKAFPITSSTLDVVDSGAFIVTSILPKENVVKPGTKNVEMLRFKLETTLEDFLVESIETTFSQNAVVTETSRLYLYDSNNVYYGVGKVMNPEGTQIVFQGDSFKSPLIMKAGSNKEFVVKADIKSDALNVTTQMTFSKVIAQGKSSLMQRVINPMYLGNKITVKADAQPADLTVASIYFDGNAQLMVKIKNSGESEVPYGMGNLVINIDGTDFGTYLLSGLADQSFRKAGGEILIPTNFRLQGMSRTIKASIDTANQIKESNENNNVLATTLTPPLQFGPDYRVNEITFDENNKMFVGVINQGNADSSTSSSNTQGKIRVIVNNAVKADFGIMLAGLKKGQSVYYATSPAFTATDNDKVRVILTMQNLLDEIDNSNNNYEEIVQNLVYTNRAEMARMAVKISKIAINTSNGPHYTDVPVSHPDYKYIETAYNEGWIKGFPSNIDNSVAYNPKVITLRSEVSSVATRVYEMPSNLAEGQHYQDVNPDSWYYSAIETIFKFIGYSNNNNSSYFHPGDNAQDSFTSWTLEVLGRVIESLGVLHSTDNPKDQTVKLGQQNVSLLALKIWGVWEPLTLDEIQVTAVDENGNTFAGINEILGPLVLVQGDKALAWAEFNNGYLEFKNLNYAISTGGKDFKFVGSIKTDAPLNKKFQLRVKKNSVYSPSGVITHDQKNVNNLIWFPPHAVMYKEFDYLGAVNTVGF